MIKIDESICRLIGNIFFVAGICFVASLGGADVAIKSAALTALVALAKELWGKDEKSTKKTGKRVKPKIAKVLSYLLFF